MLVSSWPEGGNFPNLSKAFYPAARSGLYFECEGARYDLNVGAGHLRILIIGGSAAGMFASLILVRAGHEVILLERDVLEVAPDVESAASKAFRMGAPQIVQPHIVMAKCRQLLLEHLSDVYQELLLAGVAEAPIATQMAMSLSDKTAWPGDEHGGASPIPQPLASNCWPRLQPDRCRFDAAHQDCAPSQSTLPPSRMLPRFAAFAAFPLRIIGLRAIGGVPGKDCYS